MFYFRSALVSFVVALLSGGIALAGSVKSGPQAGEKVPGPFKVLNVTGPEAGKTSCQYCNHGTRPVAVVFTKWITPEIAGLLKKIDAVTAANKEAGLGSFVVVCSDSPNSYQYFKQVAEELGIQNTILTLYKAGGPEKYRLASDADVTVLLYYHLTVKANHAFKTSELTTTAVDAILADLRRMLSEN